MEKIKSNKHDISTANPHNPRSAAEEWVFDIESYPNLFMFLAVKLEVNQEELLNNYSNLYEALTDKKNITYVLFIVYNDPNPLAKGINQLKPLQDWLKTGNKILVGYNSIDYDNILVNRILDEEIPLPDSAAGITKRLANLTKLIIEEDRDLLPYRIKEKLYKWTYGNDNKYHVLDLLTILTVNMNRPSLKHCMIHLRWPNIIDLPFEPGSIISKNNLSKMIEYLENDVLGTLAIRILIQSEIEFRVRLAEQFKDDRCYSASEVKIGKIYLSSHLETPEIDHTNRKIIKGSDLIPANLDPTTPIFKYLIKDIENVILDSEGYILESFGTDVIFDSSASSAGELNAFSDEYQVFNISKLIKYDKQFNLLGLDVSLGVGGFHSQDGKYPGTYKTTKKRRLTHIDVTSYYPSLMLNEKIAPAHLDMNKFLTTLAYLVNKRVAAKQLMKDLELSYPDSYKENEDYIAADTEQRTLKITINAVFGNLKSYYYFLYDPLALYRVTFAGQLYLIDLIEKLNISGIKVLSGNTDGLICSIPSALESKFKDIILEWEQRTGLSLEEDSLASYSRLNVNSYVVVFENGYIKTKKDFEDNLEINARTFIKGFNAPIIALALVEHFAKGKDWKKLVKNHPDIFDFCYTVRIGNQFNIVHRETIYDHDKIKASELYEDYESRTKLGNRTKKSKLAELEFYEKGYIKDVDTILQKTNRYYLSTSGKQLVKIYKEGHKTAGKEIKVFSGKETQLLNNVSDLSKIHPVDDGFNVDFDFYIMEVQKIIDKIEKNKGTRSNKLNDWQKLGFLAAAPTKKLSTEELEFLENTIKYNTSELFN